MSAALAGSGWMAELLAAFALTLAAAYWLLGVDGGRPPAPSETTDD